MNLKDEVRALVECVTAEELRTTITGAEIQFILRRLCDSDYYETQTALAAKIGISVQYLNQIIWGKRPAGPVVLRAMGMAEVVTKTYRLKRGGTHE